MLVGDDDGTRSRLRAVDPAASCASTVAVESAVIRSGILDRALGAVYEHRVDRRTREDLGIWRRSTRGGTAVPVLPGLAPDTRHGPTFATDLRWASDGRLAVASCGELACRTRVVDPATGTVVATAGTGPVVGVLDSRVIAFDVCPGFPCGLLAVDPATAEIRPIAQADGPAALGGPALVFRHGGHLVVLDTHTGAGGDVAASDDYEPVPGGSSARAGIDATRGMVSLETIGRPIEPSTARRLDPASPAIEPVEVLP